MKKQIRLIALDLDGTLLDDQKQLSENNIQALAECAVGHTGCTSYWTPGRWGSKGALCDPWSSLCHYDQWRCSGGFWKPEGG